MTIICIQIPIAMEIASSPNIPKKFWILFYRVLIYKIVLAFIFNSV